MRGSALCQNCIIPANTTCLCDNTCECMDGKDECAKCWHKKKLYNGSRLTWVTIPEFCGEMLLNVDNKQLVILTSFTAGGYTRMHAAGFHMGETRWVGEKMEKLAIKVETIPENSRDQMKPKILEALPPELRNTLLAFL